MTWVPPSRAKIDTVISSCVVRAQGKIKKRTSTENVIVLVEPFRVARAEVPLREPSDREIRQDGGVDADTKPADVVADYRRVQIVHAKRWPLLVHEPKRHRDDEAEDVCPGCPLIALPGSEEFMRETTPSDGLRVVLLWLLSGPDVSALNGKKNIALVVDDTVHEHKVQNRADQCSNDLCGEGSPWRELGVLGNLEVAQEELGLVHRIYEN